MCQKPRLLTTNLVMRTSTFKIPFAGPPRSKCRTKCSCRPGTILQKPTAFSPQRLEMCFRTGVFNIFLFFSTCHLRCAKRTYSAQKVTSWALLHWVSVSLRSRPPFPITCIDANRQNKTMWQRGKPKNKLRGILKLLKHEFATLTLSHIRTYGGFLKKGYPTNHPF